MGIGRRAFPSPPFDTLRLLRVDASFRHSCPFMLFVGKLSQKNFSLRAAKMLILIRSRPCLKRLILMSP